MQIRTIDDGRAVGPQIVPEEVVEVKGPVMDRLRWTRFLQDLTGQAFLSHRDAMRELAGADRAAAAE